jgi:hypothetical protein
MARPVSNGKTGNPEEKRENKYISVIGNSM